MKNLVMKSLFLTACAAKNWLRTLSATITFCAVAMLFSAAPARAVNTINIMDGPSALQTVAATSITSSSFTVSTPPTNAVMVVYYAAKDANSTATFPSTLTFNTTSPQTLSLLVSTNGGGQTWGDAAIYCLTNPAAGSGTITITGNASIQQVWMMAYTLTNVDTTAISNALGGAASTVSTPGVMIMSNNVNVAANNSWAAMASIGRNGASGNIVNFSPSGGTLVAANNNQGAVGDVNFSYVSGLPAGNPDVFYATNTASNGKNAMVEAVFAPFNPAPSTPATFTATGSTSPNPVQVNLSWTASSGALTYNIKRGPSSGNYTVTNVVSAASTSYVDTQVTNGFTYFYTISAANSLGTSADFSPAQSVTPTGVPQAPTGLNAIVNSPTSIALSWTGSYGASSYSVYRSTTSGNETLLASGLTSASYTDSTVTFGTVYYYEVTATGTGGEGPKSSETSVVAGSVLESIAGGGLDWNNINSWNGSNTISSALNYVTTINNGVNSGPRFGVNLLGRLRVNSPSAGGAPSPNIFAGGSVTVNPQVELLFKQITGESAGGNLILNGGMAVMAPNNAGAPTLTGSISNATDSYLGLQWGGSASSWTIASTFTGASNLTLVSGSTATTATNNLTFLFTGDISQFKGTINLGGTNIGGEILELNPTASSTNWSLTMRSDATLTLDTLVSVGSFSIGSNSVANGTYTASLLTSLGYGGTFSGSGSLAVGTPTLPVIITQPRPVSIYAGGTAHFVIQADSSVTSYQWFSNTVSVAGATTNLTINNATTGGSFYVVVSNSVGSVTSSVVMLTIIVPVEPYESAVAAQGPYAFYQFNETANPSTTPGGATAFDNANSLNGVYGIHAENGSGSGFYGDGPIQGPQPSQWPGFTSTNLAFLPANLDAQSTVVLPSLNLNTNTVTITAWINPLAIQDTNTGIFYCRGSSSVVGFGYSSTMSGGDLPLSYNWNNDPATMNWNSGLFVPQNQWSFVALTVTPTNATIYLFNAANGIASASHNYPHNVQSFNGTTWIGGDPSAANRIFEGYMDDVAIFKKALTRNQLEAMFYVASGQTNYPPTIAVQPTNVTVYAGQPAMFSVIGGGSEPLSYQWQVNTGTGATNINNGGQFSGATTSTLTINNATSANAIGATYDVILSNPWGTNTSSGVTLTVNSTGAAQNITMTNQQPIATDWNTSGYWLDNLGSVGASTSAAAEPGSTYELLAGSRMRTPVSEYSTFPGVQLTVDGNGVWVNNPGSNAPVAEVRLKPAVLPVNNASVVFTNLVMNGGQIDMGPDSAYVGYLTLGGAIHVLSNTPVYNDGANGDNSGLYIAALLSGSGTIEYHGDTAGSVALNNLTNGLNIANAGNTFSGQWNVVSGALLGSAPNSLGTNSITVGSNAILETTYDVNNTNASLVLGASGKMYLHQHDHFASVTINGTPLSPNTYSFATLNGSYPANFPATWTALSGSSFSSGSGQIIVGNGGPPPSPRITQIGLSGATLSISATNGAADGTWILLQSTNVALPLSQWQTNLTGTFNGSGNLSTNISNTATNRQEFYILKVQ